MTTKIFYSNRAFLLIPALAICVAWNNFLHGQTVASSPSVRPIVDPLSEMTPVSAQETDDGILDMPIEDLGNIDAVVPAFDIEVSSVSKQDSTIGKSPAAVYVITNEMIRRCGATCIPEVLRLAPGVEVAQLNSHDWSVSIRGYNDRYSNKLLVLVDGRSVYSPVLSGTFWDMIDMPLEDIDRIEVVRGPGGTIWGANAVNGIINIISKKAKNTQGALVSSGGGSQAYNVSTFRYGANAGRNIKYRVWGKYFKRGPEDSPGKYDDWDGGRGGFYVDWRPGGSHKDLITVQGNFFAGKEGCHFTLLPSTPGLPYQTTESRRVAENSVLTRWTHTLDDKSDWTFQTYYDQTCRYDTQAGSTANTFDVDFQYRRPVGRRHHLIAGVEYRQTHDFVRNESCTFWLVPSSRSYNVFSTFVQDEIELIDDTFYLTVGSKFEGNSFTGFEYQPSIRGLWAFDDQHVLWGAVSRAVRTPNRIDEDMRSYRYNPLTPGLFPEMMGNGDIKSEDVIAYELGYRAQASKRFAWDIALFYNRYRNIMGFVQGTPYPEGGYWVLPFNLYNNGHCDIYGFELTASWELTAKWKLEGSYSFLVPDDSFAIPAGLYGTPNFGATPIDPRNQVRLQSYWNFASNWELDAFVRYVDHLTNRDTLSYITMDLRLGWRPRKHLEFSIVGQNLFAPHHREFQIIPEYGEPTCEINRAVFAKVTWTR